MNKAVSASLERKRQAAAARARLEKATLEMAAEHRFGGPNPECTEVDMLEEATRLVREAREGA